MQHGIYRLTSMLLMLLTNSGGPSTSCKRQRTATSLVRPHGLVPSQRPGESRLGGSGRSIGPSEVCTAQTVSCSVSDRRTGPV